MSTPVGSIIIAAHDEEAVIARTLEPLSESAVRGVVEVIVVCNGCRDRTPEVARGVPGVRVLELGRPSKTAALREGERVMRPGPRLYLDADVILTAAAAVATLRALGGGVIAGRPPHRFDTTGAGLVVRRWYAVRTRLPSVVGSLWGAGCYGLSEGGRARFDDFPEVVADDLVIDSLFEPDEIVIIDTDPVIVHTPRRLRDLLLVLRRSYRSQGEADAAVEGFGRARRRQLGDLGALIRQEPSRVGDAAIYALVIVLARLRARIGPSPTWERDTSSRTPSGG